MAVLKKGMGPIKKKKVFKIKIETDVPNNFFCGVHEFCFTNMKTILQKCVPNMPYNLFSLIWSFHNLVHQFLIVIFDTLRLGQNKNC